MNKLIVVALAAVLSGCGTCLCGNDAETKTTGLTVCRLVSPANIVKPVFAWKMES